MINSAFVAQGNLQDGDRAKTNLEFNG